MAYAVGVLIGAMTCVFARVVGFDRDRAFYPTVVIVTASYYVLFAVLGGSTQAIIAESVVMTLFIAIAIAGFKYNAWLLVAALAGHGVFDLVHGHLVTNPGVPASWPAFCLAFDVVVAAVFAWIMLRRQAMSATPMMKTYGG